MKKNLQRTGVLFFGLVLIVGVFGLYSNGYIGKNNSQTNFKAQSTLSTDGLPVYHVDDFGATPNDDSLDVSGIKSAILAAKATGGTIEFTQNGIYNIKGMVYNDSTEYYKPIFWLNDLHNVTFDGNNATLLGIANQAGVFSMLNSTNVAFKNIKFDRDQESLPFTAGKIVASTSNYIDIEVAPGHPVTDRTTFQTLVKWDVSENTPFLANSGTNRGNSSYKDQTCSKINEKTMRCTTERNWAVPLGIDVVARAVHYQQNTFTVRKSSDLIWDNISIYAAAGMGIYTNGCKNIFVEGYNVIPKPNSGRRISTNTDAAQFASTYGDSVIYKNAVVRNALDDYFNASTHYFQATHIDFSTNTVSLVSPKSGEKPWYATPLYMDKFMIGKQGNELEPGEIITLKSFENSSDVWKVTFHEDLSERLQVGDVLSNESSLPRNTIVDNLSGKGHNNRGVVFGGDNILFKNSTLSHHTSSAVLINSDIRQRYQGSLQDDIYIVNNTFNKTVSRDGTGFRGAINIRSKYKNIVRVGSDASSNSHSNINICDNVFTNSFKYDAEVGSATKVTFHGNSTDKGFLTNQNTDDVAIDSRECDEFEYRYLSLLSGTPSDFHIENLFPINPVLSPENITICSPDASFFRIMTALDGTKYLATNANLDASSPEDIDQDNIYDICLEYDRGNANTNTIEMKVQVKENSGNSQNNGVDLELLCGNGNIDTGEECDFGPNNGIVCYPSYYGACGYCNTDCEGE